MIKKILVCLLALLILGGIFAPIAQAASSTEWLAMLIYHEARGESMKGKIAVGNVVVNRVKHGFGDSISDVIRAKGQFSTYDSGFWVSRGNREDSYADCVEAAERAMDGEKEVSSDVLFFRMADMGRRWRNLTFVEKIGVHNFYRK